MAVQKRWVCKCIQTDATLQVVLTELFQDGLYRYLGIFFGISHSVSADRKIDEIHTSGDKQLIWFCPYTNVMYEALSAYRVSVNKIHRRHGWDLNIQPPAYMYVCTSKQEAVGLNPTRAA